MVYVTQAPRAAADDVSLRTEWQWNGWGRGWCWVLARLLRDREVAVELLVSRMVDAQLQL